MEPITKGCFKLGKLNRASLLLGQHEVFFETSFC